MPVSVSATAYVVMVKQNTSGTIKRRNESDVTYELKWAAWRWLRDQAGCKAIAFEVRLEGPRGRIADVVGVGPQNRVYVVEVKASRSDAARDDNTKRKAAKLEGQRAAIDETVELSAGILEAAARNGDRGDQDAELTLARREYEGAVKRRDAYEKRVSVISVKFHDEAYLRTAHCHYLMAPPGLIRPSELPPYWGLLDESPAIVVEAPVKQIREATQHILRAVARANTRDLATACGQI